MITSACLEIEQHNAEKTRERTKENKGMSKIPSTPKSRATYFDLFIVVVHIIYLYYQCGAIVIFVILGPHSGRKESTTVSKTGSSRGGNHRHHQEELQQQGQQQIIILIIGRKKQNVVNTKTLNKQ
jgi:hypothetical protein